MSLVIPKAYSRSRQESYKQNRRLAIGKTSQDVSYSSYHTETLKPQSLVILVKPSFFPETKATERGLRASFAEELSILRTKPLPHQQDLDKSLVSPADREEDVLDWDFYLENPPLKPVATIELEFEYRGRSKPIPVTDPWDE